MNLSEILRTRLAPMPGFGRAACSFGAESGSEGNCDQQPQDFCRSGAWHFWLISRGFRRF